MEAYEEIRARIALHKGDVSGWHEHMLNVPTYRAEWEARQRREARATRLTRWMRRIPVVGRLTETFWFCLLDEGIYQTLKPRWGAITFSFLNDGMKPTLWHTWQQVARYDRGYSGIWVGGAPRNRADAEAKLARYKEAS